MYKKDLAFNNLQDETIKLLSLRKRHYSFILKLLLKNSIQVI